MKIPALFKNKEKKTEDRPTSGTITIKCQTKSLQKLKAELNSIIVFKNVEENEKQVTAMIVESTDKNKNPYLYIKIVFSKDQMEAFYTITPEVANPSLRKLQVMKSVFTFMSLLETKAVISLQTSDLYMKVMEAFDLEAAFADNDSLKIKYAYEQYAAENAKMKTDIAKLKEEKERLNYELLELEKRSQSLEDRLNHLQSMTDKELDREIVKWVEDHYGKLNEEKFCNSFDLSSQRLEERLDSLSKRGVIRIV
ncbi:hypothetical protein JXA56_02415 [Candidatus Micrarchaeota archaeon]|nr:hypothetical protein [Candidatus Micrarchaeota archaeon]